MIFLVLVTSYNKENKGQALQIMSASFQLPNKTLSEIIYMLSEIIYMLETKFTHIRIKSGNNVLLWTTTSFWIPWHIIVLSLEWISWDIKLTAKGFAHYQIKSKLFRTSTITDSMTMFLFVEMQWERPGFKLFSMHVDDIPNREIQLVTKGWEIDSSVALVIGMASGQQVKRLMHFKR